MRARGGGQFTVSGKLTTLYTVGFAENDQKLASGLGDGFAESRQNGFFTEFTPAVTFRPFDFIELSTVFLARIRPGSPYIPLQLEKADPADFEFKLDSVYGRIDVLRGLRYDIPIPLSVFIKAGLFDTKAKNYQTTTQYGLESVLAKVRTKSTYALQLETAYDLPASGKLSLAVTMNQKLDEELSELYDTDGSVASHGDEVLDTFAFPLHAAVSLDKLKLPFADLSAEFVYALHAEHIYSGQNFGGDVRLDIPLLDDVLTIPVGLGVSYSEKNIDVLAGTAVEKKWSGLYPYDGDTTGFRGALRVGLGTGVTADLESIGLKTALNLGLAYTQAGHIYRDTVNIVSLGVDGRVTYQDRFFLGFGVLAGTLGEVEWKTKDAELANDNFSHVFKLAENIGWEVFAGLQFGQSKFLVGYNNNKGLAMNYGVEAIPGGQYKYRQASSDSPAGLLERGGLFIKAVVAF